MRYRVRSKPWMSRLVLKRPLEWVVLCKAVEVYPSLEAVEHLRDLNKTMGTAAVGTTADRGDGAAVTKALSRSPVGCYCAGRRRIYCTCTPDSRGLLCSQTVLGRGPRTPLTSKQFRISSSACIVWKEKVEAVRIEINNLTRTFPMACPQGGPPAPRKPHVWCWSRPTYFV